MNVRKFLLENEKGQQFNMNNFKDSCLLTSPSNLGISYQSEFQQLGNIFIENNRTISKKDPSGTIYFKNYDKCKEFIDFIEKSNKMKFVYKIPIKNGEKTYYRDISIKEFQKTEKKVGMLACPVTFNGLSLWYEQIVTNYTIEKIDNEIQWDFVWDSRFADYTSRSIAVENDGHVEAEVKVEILGHVINPGIYVYHNKEIYAGLTLPITIENGEKLLYSSRDQEIYIRKQKQDKTIENLFKNEYIDLNNNNIFKIPKGSSEIALTAENNITSAKLYLYKYYKVV